MASNEAQRLVIKIAADTSEFESSLNKLKSTASGIVSSAEGGLGKPPSGGGSGKSPATVDAETLATSLNQTALNLADVRAQSKAVGMDIYRNIGNPFLVVSSLSQRITGIYQLQRDVEKAGAATERLARQLAQARRSGDSVQIKNLNTQLDAAIKKQGELNKRLGGVGTKMRGVADFGVNQFLTAGLFGIFQLNTMLLQAIMTPIIEGATKMFREIFDKAGLAKEKMLALASAVEKAGGAAAYAASIGASPGSRAEEVAGVASLMQRQISYAEKLSAYVNALSSVGELQNEGQKAIFEALKTVAPALRNPTQAASERFQYGMSPSEQIASNYTKLQSFFATFGPEQTAKFNELYQAAGGTSMSFKALQDIVAKVVTGMFELTDAQTSQRTKIQEAISKFQAQQQLDQLERERWSLTGSMEGIDRNAGADKWFIAAANAAKQQERWQKAAAAYSQQLTRRQQRQTLGQAAADVTRAGIGRPGQSGFELAAAVLEARARAQEARQQIDIQRKQEAIQRKIEYWGSVQANADRQQRILANAVALGMQQAQMALTVDPASGQLLARFVASDVWKMISGAIANNTPTPTNTGGR